MATAQNSSPSQWRDRWRDPWREHWASELRSTLKKAALALERILGLRRDTLGVVPAVYFTRLRMGVVPFLRWDDGGPDVQLAFPWAPEFIPPPFTCFAPPTAVRTERWFGLITRVASTVDAFIDGRATVAQLSGSPDLSGLRIGVHSWRTGERRKTVADEWQLRESGVTSTSVAFLLPESSGWLPYVPLFYLQAADMYDTKDAEAAILLASRGSASRSIRKDREVLFDIGHGLRAAASAAHTRAREWLNQKTQLLNRAGFEGLKEDLEWRVARGERFAEVFFDIDHFKEANGLYTYDGADLLAARVTDRVLAFAQSEVARAYAEAAAFRRATGEYEAVAPDSFRALIAHVSGDEFRVFVRQQAPLATDAFHEDDPFSFATSLLHAIANSDGRDASAATSVGGTLVARHERALRASAAARRAAIDDVAIVDDVLAAKVTASAGVAFDDAPAMDVQVTLSGGGRAAARARLNALDVRSERAAAAAKKDGRNRAVVYAETMSDIVDER